MTNYNKNAPESIQEMFGTIAKSYDRTNALLSLQMHRYWNRRLILETADAPSGHLADLCCGTGEIAFSWLKKQPGRRTAYLIDFCHEMLACAKQKATQRQIDCEHNLSYLQADVQSIPLENNCISVVTMAYGIRNVQNPALCFKEAFRVMKSGGKLCILELTEPTGAILRFGHRLYLRKILPIIGKLATSNRQAYEYLSRSIGSFVKPQDLASLLKQAEFKEIKITPLIGGIATIITAQK